jgi:hypothetical protein
MVVLLPEGAAEEAAVAQELVQTLLRQVEMVALMAVAAGQTVDLDLVLV